MCLTPTYRETLGLEAGLAGLLIRVNRFLAAAFLSCWKVKKKVCSIVDVFSEDAESIKYQLKLEITLTSVDQSTRDC